MNIRDIKNHIKTQGFIHQDVLTEKSGTPISNIEFVNNITKLSKKYCVICSSGVRNDGMSYIRYLVVDPDLVDRDIGVSAIDATDYWKLFFNLKRGRG